VVRQFLALSPEFRQCGDCE